MGGSGQNSSSGGSSGLGSGLDLSGGGDDNLMSSINVTPFVDVVLVLLVIFMVTAPMLVKEILELNLPKSKVSDGKVSQTLGLAVNKQGNFLLNGKLIDEISLASEISLAVRSTPDIQGIIAADHDVIYGRVVKLIEILKSSGLNKFAVQIEKTTEKK